MNSPDNREYFRLTDKIHIACKVITKRDIEERDAADFFTFDPNFHLFRDIYQLEMESSEILRGIKEKNRQLGNFLQNLNKRISLLAQSIRNLKQDGNQSNTAETEISETGISFVSAIPLKNGDFVALQLLFESSQLGLSCFAVVHHSHHRDSDNTYKIGAEFVNPDYSTQKILSRQIIRRQSEQARSRRRQQTDDN